MSQIADILQLAKTAQQHNVDAVLATVVRTEGSAYRRAGAMMLICEDGRSVGMISGGCLEPHIRKRAFWLTRNGATLQTYQTGDDVGYSEDGNAQPARQDDLSSKAGFTEDSLYSQIDELNDELNFGLGCNGRVHVLFERLATAMPVLDAICRARETQQPKIIATLIRAKNTHDSHLKNATLLPGQDLPIGTRLDLDAYHHNGQLARLESDYHQALPNAMSRTFTDSVKALSNHSLDDKDSKYVFIEQDGLSTEWLIQRLQPQIRLLICGAGDDVKPLVTMAKLQDWHVSVIDSRPRYATRLRFPQADTFMPLPLRDTDKLLELSRNAAVALMSHSLTQDRMRLAVLLEHAEHYRYIGQLGPRYRTERLLNEIRASQADASILEAGINKLHYPIGYKLGGDGPAALALGIIAEINAVMHQVLADEQPANGFAHNNEANSNKSDKSSTSAASTLSHV